MNKQGIVPTEEHQHNPGLSNSTLLSYLPVPLIVTDAHGIITTFNRKAQEFLGESLRNGIRYEEAWKGCKLYHFDGAPFPGNYLNVTEIISSGEPSRERTMFVERAGSGRILLREEIAPTYQAGQLTGMVSCFYHILSHVSEARHQDDQPHASARLNDRNIELKRNDDQFLKMVEEV